MENKVLVAYASTYSSTQEVAEVVTATLRDHELAVDLQPARDVRSLEGYRAVVLDTFDMLSPAYDRPLTHPELEGALARAGVRDIRRLPSHGLSLVGEKA